MGPAHWTFSHITEQLMDKMEAATAFYGLEESSDLLIERIFTRRVVPTLIYSPSLRIIYILEHSICVSFFFFFRILYFSKERWNINQETVQEPCHNLIYPENMWSSYQN